MAEPSVMIAVDPAFQDVTNAALVRASNTICRVPANMNELIGMLTGDQADPASLL